MKIAIFRNIDSGYESVNPESFEPVCGYLRISEYIEVDLVPLEHSGITDKEITVLEAKKEKILAEARISVSGIERRIRTALSLPQLSSEAEIVAPEQITTKANKPGAWETRDDT